MTGDQLGAEGEYAFLVVYDEATLRFDTSAETARDVVEQTNKLVEEGRFPSDPRTLFRSIVKDGILDGDHIHPSKSQGICNATVYLCLTNQAYLAHPQHRGFIIQITNTGPLDSNFRFMLAPDRVAVDEMTAKVREGRKYVASYTDAEVARAVSRKKAPRPKDPSLEAPPRPRPDRWLQDLDRIEKILGKGRFSQARHCLEEGALFVWRSRQLADAAQEDIDASLAAMAEYGRLRLPHPAIYAETRDWIEVPVADAPPKRIPARLAVAAVQQGEAISFWGFAEFQDRTMMSVLEGRIDPSSFADGSRALHLIRPEFPPGTGWDEGLNRRIAFACGDRLLELLFLLSTAGVAKEKVQPAGGTQGKKSKAQRRKAPVPHTIVRVPLHYQPASAGQGQGNGTSGRWVRPHVRRAHMWGKNTRPVEEQHWRESTLVGADKSDGTDLPRPEYRVG